MKKAIFLILFCVSACKVFAGDDALYLGHYYSVGFPYSTNYSVAFGYAAMQVSPQNPAALQPTNCSAFGTFALENVSAGLNEVGIGQSALTSDTLGQYNTGIGAAVLRNMSTNQYNTAVGYYALGNYTTGTQNIALGEQAGANLFTGSHNIYIGSQGVNGDNYVMRLGDVQTSVYFAGGLNFNNATNSGTYYGNGAGLTGIPSSSLQSGQVNTVLGSNSTYTGNVNLTNLNANIVNATNALQINGTSILNTLQPQSSSSNFTATGVNTLGSITETNGHNSSGGGDTNNALGFFGNASGLTNLQSTNLAPQQGHTSILFPEAEWMGAASLDGNSLVALANVTYLCVFRPKSTITVSNVNLIEGGLSSQHFSISVYNAASNVCGTTGIVTMGASSAYVGCPFTNMAGGSFTFTNGMFYLIGWNSDGNSTGTFYCTATATTRMSIALQNSSSYYIPLFGTAGNAASGGANPSSTGTITTGSVAKIPILVFTY